MRWEGGNKSSNVEDRRGQSLGGPMMIGGGGLGAIVVVIIALLMGADPQDVLNQIGQGAPAEKAAPGQPRADDKQAEFSSVVLGSTEQVWAAEFEQRGRRYAPPTLVLYDNYTTTACGGGSAAAGPFYCPADQKLYLDLAFFRELDAKFNAPGDFAPAYVIAHEVGHHIQTLLGVSDQVRQAQQAAGQREGNALQVRMELQADCLAGVWAAKAPNGSVTLDPGDIDEAVGAAAAVGDDTLQKRTRGMVVPDAFTHGTSAQRVEWFKRGYESGRMESCDTFGS